MGNANSGTEKDKREKRKMKIINVSFEDAEMKKIRKAKGKQSWHDFILDCVELGNIPVAAIGGNYETI